MSLINDALKRARQSQQKNLPPGAPSLPPVEFGSRSNIGWILPLAIVAFIAAAFFFIGLAMSKRPVAKIATAPEFSATQTKSVAAPAVISNPPKPTTVTTSPPIAVVAPPMPVAMVPMFSSNSPKLKLQGIVYDPARPWAIVNDRNVSIGDRVGEFRVKAISKYTVTLVGADGKEKVLELGD